MDCIATRLPNHQTGAYSSIVLDYLDRSASLRPFYSYEPTTEGIRQAIEARKQFPVNRQVLVDELRKQYAITGMTSEVESNLQSLLSATTFTITTAHQNNIFTGPLYFIYKILHAIRLAGQLNREMPGHRFVPVYYMGSEDADLAELNHIHLNGEKLEWNTRQTGAVGRMKIDGDLIKLIDAIEGQLAVLPFGEAAIRLVRENYRVGEDIQTATFRMVNALFGDYGLIVLLPDNGVLKKQLTPVFEDELLNQVASGLVEKSSEKLGAFYKVQAHPRDINLFYLLDDKRERIEYKNERFEVVHTGLSFSKEQMLEELNTHPERFSPNVILRGLFQESILPNIAFIGGGGELAYWLELKGLFEHYRVPYPVLVLRNSFLVIERKWQEKLVKLGFTLEELFLPAEELVNRLVKRETGKKVELNGTLTATEELYEAIKKQAGSIDFTLVAHVDSLKTTTLYRLKELQKKMLRAEKRKFADQQRQIAALKQALFPSGNLQERVENMLGFYALWGADFIQKLHNNSLALEQEFVVLTEKG